MIWGCLRGSLEHRMTQTKSPPDIVRAGFLLEVCIKFDVVLSWRS